MRTVLVANRKDGCGKTVGAMTFAAALAGRGERVALADADRSQKSYQPIRPQWAPVMAALV
jgi:chromosome partitioning protein